MSFSSKHASIFAIGITALCLQPCINANAQTNAHIRDDNRPATDGWGCRLPLRLAVQLDQADEFRRFLAARSMESTESPPDADSRFHFFEFNCVETSKLFELLNEATENGFNLGIVGGT